MGKVNVCMNNPFRRNIGMTLIKLLNSVKSKSFSLFSYFCHLIYSLESLCNCFVLNVPTKSLVEV